MSLRELLISLVLAGVSAANSVADTRSGPCRYTSPSSSGRAVTIAEQESSSQNHDQPLECLYGDSGVIAALYGPPRARIEVFTSSVPYGPGRSGDEITVGYVQS